MSNTIYMPAVASATFRVPQQARSLESLNRLLDAAETVLAESGYEGATLAAICRRAGLTIGAYYARFASKEDLLGPLVDRLHEAMGSAIASLADDPAAPRALAESVERFVRAMVALYRDRRDLIRSLVLCARANPLVLERLQRNNAEAMAAIATWLRRHRDEMTHPERSEGIALLSLFTTLRELLLDQYLLPPERYALDDEELVRELTRIYCACVGAACDL